MAIAIFPLVSDWEIQAGLEQELGGPGVLVTAVPLIFSLAKIMALIYFFCNLFMFYFLWLNCIRILIQRQSTLSLVPHSDI